MAYTFNVSRYGEHIFATAEYSCCSFMHAQYLYNLLQIKFPESEGYKVKCNKIEKTWHDITEQIVNSINGDTE